MGLYRHLLILNACCLIVNNNPDILSVAVCIALLVSSAPSTEPPAPAASLSSPTSATSSLEAFVLVLLVLSFVAFVLVVFFNDIVETHVDALGIG